MDWCDILVPINRGEGGLGRHMGVDSGYHGLGTRRSTLRFSGNFAGSADVLDVYRDKGLPCFRRAGQKQALYVAKAADHVRLAQDNMRDANAGALGKAGLGVSGDHIGQFANRICEIQG